MCQRRKLAILLAILGTASPAATQEEALRKSYGSGSDTTVLVESIFGSAAQQGALPFRITIRNNSGKDRAWRVQFRELSSSNLRTVSAFEFEVENGTEVRHEVAVRISPEFLGHSYRGISVDVHSAGLESANRHLGQPSNSDFPMLAMSKPLAQRSLARLDDELKKAHSGNQFFAKPFDPEALPSDWLGYTALDGLLIDEESWNKLAPSQEQSIVEWVRLGGLLEVYTKRSSTIADLNLPGVTAAPGDSKAELSLGTVRLKEWNGMELGNTTDLFRSFDNIETRNDEYDQDFGKNWSLYQKLKTEAFNPVLVFSLLIVFAILVAPVNLFYFAGRGKRHRLFITTPIISVSACLLIVLLILFKDGLGGRGTRILLADFQPHPDEMRLYLTQEQFSTTGVMLDPGFTSEERLDINPVNLPASAFNPFSRQGSRITEYSFLGNVHKGGFFRSRSEQAFHIRNVQPTRSRVERLSNPSGNRPPELVSNLPVTTGKLFYVDTNGRYWATPDDAEIGPGSPLPLAPTGRNAVRTWLVEAAGNFSRSNERRIVAMLDDRDRFFTLAPHAEPLLLETHPSIHWKNETILLTGSTADRTSTGTSTPGANDE